MPESENVHDPVEVFFDTMPLPDGKLLFHVDLIRHKRRSCFNFSINQSEKERMVACLHDLESLLDKAARDKTISKLKRPTQLTREELVAEICQLIMVRTPIEFTIEASELAAIVTRQQREATGTGELE